MNRIKYHEIIPVKINLATKIARVFSCSSTCFKTHKETPCTPLEPEKVAETLEKSQEKVYQFPTEDTVPRSRLEQLKESQELKDCLKNPQVRDIVRAVLTSKDPTEAIALAMTEPIFVQLADACLNVVEPNDTDLLIRETKAKAENVTTLEDMSHLDRQIKLLQQNVT